MTTGYDDWWFERTWSDFRRGTDRVRVCWDGGEAQMRLYDDGVVTTACGFKEALPFEAPMVHVAWSGDMVMGCKTYDFGPTSPENAIRLVRPGDVTWDHKFGELCVTYGDAEARLPSGPNTLVVFGEIADGLADLAKFCSERRFAGVGVLRFEALEERS